MKLAFVDIKNQWGGLFAATLVGALAGAAGGHFTSKFGEEPTLARAEKGHAERGDDSSGAVRRKGVDTDRSDDASTRQQIAALERRVSLLTAALARGDSSLANEVDGKSGDVLDEVDVADPVFEAAVLDIIDRETGRQESERESRRAQLHAERGQRFSAELTEKLALDAEQQTVIAQVVTDHFTRFRELRNDESPDRPVTRRDFQTRMEEINKEALGQLKEVMTPAQFEKYQALDPDDQIGFGWGSQRRERLARPQN